MLAMPARSDRNATWRPSGDHAALDGWRMSISCSIVSRPPARAADGCGAASTMNTRAPTVRESAITAKNFFMAVQYTDGWLSMESHRATIANPSFRRCEAEVDNPRKKSGATKDRFDRVWRPDLDFLPALFFR